MANIIIGISHLHKIYDRTEIATLYISSPTPGLGYRYNNNKNKEFGGRGLSWVFKMSWIQKLKHDQVSALAYEIETKVETEVKEEDKLSSVSGSKTTQV